MKTRLPEGLFRFTWQVDQLGYDLKYRHREPEPGRRALILGEIVGWHLVRKGGPLREYWPLDDHPGLFRQFANLPEDLSPEDQSTEPKDLLAFANEFGLLGYMSGTFTSKSEPPDSEDLHSWQGYIHSFRLMVDAIEDGREQAACDAFDTDIRPRMTVRVEPGPFGSRRPSLHVTPLTLVGALWLQVAGQLTQGLEFRKCKQCPTHFPVGTGTRFRMTKIFCSDRCRVAWNRQKKKEASK